MLFQLAALHLVQLAALHLVQLSALYLVQLAASAPHLNFLPSRHFVWYFLCPFLFLGHPWYFLCPFLFLGHPSYFLCPFLFLGHPTFDPYLPTFPHLHHHQQYLLMLFQLAALHLVQLAALHLVQLSALYLVQLAASAPHLNFLPSRHFVWYFLCPFLFLGHPWYFLCPFLFLGHPPFDPYLPHHFPFLHQHFLGLCQPPYFRNNQVANCQSS